MESAIRIAIAPNQTLELAQAQSATLMAATTLTPSHGDCRHQAASPYTNLNISYRSSGPNSYKFIIFAK